MTTAGTAIVTGARRGIGLGVAKALAAAGFDVAVVDVAARDEACGGCRRGWGG